MNYSGCKNERSIENERSNGAADFSIGTQCSGSLEWQKNIPKGGFVKLERSEDDTLYIGECTGSGKSNYITSADYIDEANPVFRCSCPSRQFPCKHSIGLIYEMFAKKEFGICEIPEDIQKKREKKQVRDNKANEAAKPENEMTEEERAICCIYRTRWMWKKHVTKSNCRTGKTY